MVISKFYSFVKNVWSRFKSFCNNHKRFFSFAFAFVIVLVCLFSCTSIRGSSESGSGVTYYNKCKV